MNSTGGSRSSAAPRFGIVGEEQKLTFRVIDDGQAPGGTAEVTISLNGNEIATEMTEPGTDVPFSFTVPRGGNNILEFAVSPVAGEVTEANNRAVHVLDGIRENLRVLLVSGEPHAGERAWRNLLKSDASVDLVHFTILRPPEKQDGTPINELSLIAFPTRELFVEKIKEFDLIIFDRYQHRGVLPILYYDNIAQYVENGGALLIAAGPEHAGEDSIATTPLSAVLPAMPTGAMNEEGFYPRLSEDGKKHPVTRGLEGAGSEPPQWGRWFRTVDVQQPLGQTVMNAADGKPLLVLNRVGKGRVAMLLSDQGWLWARGFEGGGPSVSLYRRIGPLADAGAGAGRGSADRARRQPRAGNHPPDDFGRSRCCHRDDAVRQDRRGAADRRRTGPLQGRTAHHGNRSVRNRQRRTQDARPCRQR